MFNFGIIKTQIISFYILKKILKYIKLKHVDHMHVEYFEKLPLHNVVMLGSF